MPYKVLLNGGAKSFTPHWFNNSNTSITLPIGTSITATLSDSSVGSVTMSSGNVVFTPNGTVTGNVFISCVASLPTGQDVYATILVHVTDNTNETTDYGAFTIT